MSALANKRERDKLESQKRENLYLLTLDEMRKAGEDPYEKYPLGMFDTSQYEEFEGIAPSGTPEEMQREAINAAIYNWRERNKDKMEKVYEDFVSSGLDYEDYKKAQGDTKPDAVTTLTNSIAPTNVVETVQDGARKVGSVLGGAADTIYDILGIPIPDHTVFNPRTGTGTITWGDPKGTTYGRIGTSPGGTSYGVLTGVPVLDQVLTTVFDVISGRQAAGDVLTKEQIEDILISQSREVFGLPGDLDPSVIREGLRKIGEGQDSKSVFGVDLTG